MTEQPMDLEHRITELQNPENQGSPFQPRDWILLTLTGVVLPICLLVWGW